MFKAIAVTPTKGNKGSRLTTIVTRRSEDAQKNKNFTEEGFKYIQSELVKEIIKKVGETEASKVLTKHIMDNQAINEMDIKETGDLIDIEEGSSMASTLSGEIDFRLQRAT